MDCSICLDALDSGVVALPCGHRFHAACLAQCAAAVGTAATTSRRGTLTACPNCRTTSRVVPATSAAHRVGEKVLALWGHKWFPGDVYAVKDGGSAYEIAWDDEDSSNTIPASRVRAAPLTVDVDAPTARDARAAAVVTPRAAPPVEPMSPARPPTVAPSRDEPCRDEPWLPSPSSNADVVKRLACGRTALACCAINGEIPDCYVTLDTIVLTSAKAEATWDSLTALNRRRATKLELAGEWMIDHGVRKLYLHRACYRTFEHLRLRDPLASVTVIDTNPAPAVDVAP